MKSQLLNQQVKKTLGSDGEAVLSQQIERASAGEAPPQGGGLSKLFELVDNTYEQYAVLLARQNTLSGDAYSDWDLNLGVIKSGFHWKKILGYQPEDLDNKVLTWQGLVHPDDLQALQSQISTHREQRTACFELECRLRNKNEAWHWLLVRGMFTARDSEGLPTRLLLLQRDISQAKIDAKTLIDAKEAAVAAVEARGAFLANMSHEIRTPMNGIIGMTELALDTRLDSEQRHYLKTVKTSADALLTIINDILDYSKIEAGKLQFENLEFSVRDTVFDAARVLAVQAHKKGLELVVDIAPEVPASLLGDPGRLRQVLINLIGNAVKFTEQGEVVLRVTQGDTLGGAVFLGFSVRDTGIGIPADKQHSIFDSFTQADESTTRRFGGTGLGLTICARLIEAMNGAIRVESELGKGSTFSFEARFNTLPVAVQTANEFKVSGRRALVVVENAHTGLCLKNELERIGVDTTVEHDPTQAAIVLARTRTVNQPYDFIFADALMAAPAGRQLINDWNASQRPERLIALLTTENQRSELATLRTLEVSGHLVKPVGPQDIQEAIKLTLPGSESNDASFELAPAELELVSTSDHAVLDILLVEDNPINQEIALRLLQRQNHRVKVANHGAEAVDLFEHNRFDIVLMDMEMPVLNGIEATEAIRAREMRRSWVMSEGFKTAYIIAMTANVMSRDRDLCYEAGMDDFVGKPLKAQDLFAAIDRGRNRDLEIEATDDNQNQPRVDFELAAEKLGDRELLVTMAQMFLGEWDNHLQAIHLAIQARSASEMVLKACDLRSLLAMFHADEARKWVIELDSWSAATNLHEWAECDRIFDALLAEMAQIRPLFEKFAGRASG